LQGLPSQQLDVACIGHLLRFCQIGDQWLNLCERHVVQAIAITKLKRTQTDASKQRQGLKQPSQAGAISCR
jgi:hypothetical protein